MIILPSAKGFPLKPALIKDPYYSSVTALLHMSGTNGSTTFIDNSPNGYTVTRLGNPSISTAQSKFNNGSAFFSYGSYLRMPIGAGSFYGFSEWTCECWIYPTSINVFGSATLVDFYIFGQGGFRWSINSGGYLTYTDSGSGGATRTSNGNITFNTWNHIAICRSIAFGGVLFLINGGLSGTLSIVGNPTTPSQLVYIGALPNGESPFDGYMSDLRFTKSVVRYPTVFTYPSTYTMPTSPFPDA
jgi:hypothetical protein